LVGHPERPGSWQVHPDDQKRLKQAMGQQKAHAENATPEARQNPHAAVITRPSSYYPPANPAGKDTQERYKRRDGTYTPERQELHTAILAEMAHGITATDKPVFYMTGGGASGKGSLLTSGVVQFPAQRMLIDADECKKSIPDYREMTQAKNTDAACFSHEESADVSAMAIDHAAKNRLAAIYDSVGDSGVEKLSGKIKKMKAGGAKVIAHYVTCDTELAIQRAWERGDKTGRYVPEAVLRSAYASVSRILPELVKTGLCDELTLWDTNESGTPRKVASAVGANLTVHDDALWKRFLDKANR